ncbi:MAG: PEP-CTERM sorting domain-containing protein [Armatimonadetes bacterium]|jgi:hypothetical protein|nr:PEP-CTERM sorting domain-containing protein [Armatimonadota bacterium]
MRLRLVVSLSVLAFLLSAQLSLAQSWEAHQLEGSASWIDNHNRIAGSAYSFETGTVRAVVWNSDGVIIANLGDGCADFISDSGLVAGVSNSRAVVWDLNGGRTEYDPIDGFTMSRANYVTSSGLVIGVSSYDDLSSVRVYTIWQPDGTAMTVGDLTGDPSFLLWGITDSGVLYGSTKGYNVNQYDTWTSETGFVSHDIPGWVLAISACGNVCGFFPGFRQLVGVDPTELLLPDGAVSAIGYGISDSGYVAGRVDDKAAVWDRDGLVHLLGDGTARKVNNQGTVIGNIQLGAEYNYQGKTVVWVMVPEPSSIIIVLCGFGSVGLLRRKRT